MDEQPVDPFDSLIFRYDQPADVALKLDERFSRKYILEEGP
jgi:hypothetical protein